MTRDLSVFNETNGNVDAYWHYCGWMEVGSQSTNTSTIIPDRLFYLPFFCSVGAVWTKMGVLNGNTFTGVNARLGIYNNDLLNSIPTTLLTDFGVLNVASTGANELTISQKLERRWYWAAVVFASNITTRRPAYDSSTGACARAFRGHNSSSVITDMCIGFYESYTYGALPSSATINTANFIPYGDSIPFPLLTMRKGV